MKLFVDVLQVGADRVDANGEAVGDFFGGVALREVLQDFLLALRETFEFGDLPGLVPKGLDDPTGNLVAHRRPALLDILDSAQNVRRVRSLEQVAAGAGLEGAKDALV